MVDIGGEEQDTTDGMDSGPLLPAHQALVDALLDWFERNKRDLPWRKRYTPYEVWISEIMLQQTQMERGAAYFERWMERFPTLHSVAAASEDEVLKAWEGLGYYARARNLHACAKELAARHGGKLPADRQALLALPGIGSYTAGAVLSIAYNLPEVAVDANVERVFARLFDVDTPVKSPAAGNFIRHMAERLLPPGRAREFNQALMELGALVCGKKPRCEECPAAFVCMAKRLGIVAERPVPGRRIGCTALEIVSGILVHSGRVYLQRRLETGVWAGLWELPGGRLEQGETPAQGIMREFEEETEFRTRVTASLGLVRHAYTRYRIAMHCFLLEVEGNEHSPDMPAPVLHAASDYRWAAPDELEQYAMPAAHRKLVDSRMDTILAAAGAEGTGPGTVV